MWDVDGDLLARLKQGQEPAVREWFETYQQRLLKYVLIKINCTKDAEEIVQETFINCLRHLPLFRGGSSIMTWMVSIARHEVADYYRKKYAKKANKTLPLGELLLQAPIHNAHETSDKVRLVLCQMSSQYQELLQLKYVDRKQVRQIAQELGRTVKAVESDLFRARNEFRYLWLEIS